MEYAIRAKKVYCEDRVLEDAVIVIKDKKIADIVEDKSKKIDTLLDFSRYNAIPGLIDLHIHGAKGFDVMDGSFEALDEISKYLCQRGITSFLATTITESIENIKRSLVNISYSKNHVTGAKILGAYLEGPYITKEHKGAHPENLIREINLEEILNLINVSDNNIKIITIAPEKNNSIKLINEMLKKGIKISMGHTNATYDITIDAIQAGANIAVHTFNGMKGFNHREPGVLGAVLLNQDVYCELIADYVHVHEAAIEMLLRCKNKDKIVLISDSMRAAGLKDGEYMLGALKVIVESGIARTETKSLAGSTTNVMECVKKMINKNKVEPIDAINMASLNPSKLLNMDNEIGSIKIGKKADMVFVDDEFNVMLTMIDGQIVYRNTESKFWR